MGAFIENAFSNSVHIRSKNWLALSREQRDGKLRELGIEMRTLSEVRELGRRERIIAAAKIAFNLDPEANSDFIEYIAGYDGRGGLYHEFRSILELKALVGSPSRDKLVPIKTRESEIDLASFVPETIAGRPVYTEQHNDDSIQVWQKINGGSRSLIVKRRVSKTVFLAGVTAYSCEGTKYSSATRTIEFVNSSPSILMVFVSFMEALGIDRSRFNARIRAHGSGEVQEAMSFWCEDFGLSKVQFTRPLVFASHEHPTRKLLILELRYSNTMLQLLLTQWREILDKIVRECS